MLASRAVRWKFEFSVVRRRRPDAAGRHRAALGCGFEGWLEPVTAGAKVDCLPLRRNEGTTAVRKKRPFADKVATGRTRPKVRVQDRPYERPGSGEKAAVGGWRCAKASRSGTA